jgi:phosphohistidine phosphatase
LQRAREAAMLAGMKTLLVLRHAKADREEPLGSDHERTLTKKGAKAARKMGELLREKQRVPELVLSSTAERARSTAELAASEAGYRAKIELLPELYLAEPPAYLDALRRLGGDASRVLVVGHNPGIETLIFRLTGEAEHMPTAALAECELPIESWSQLISDVRGTLANVWRPREVDE